jgi:methyl-accepting chemotaxis protein
MKINAIGKKVTSFLSSVISTMISSVKKLLKKRPGGKAGKAGKAEKVGRVGKPSRAIGSMFSGKSILLRRFKIKNRLIMSFNLLLVVMLLVTVICS